MHASGPVVPFAGVGSISPPLPGTRADHEQPRAMSVLPTCGEPSGEAGLRGQVTEARSTSDGCTRSDLIVPAREAFRSNSRETEGVGWGRGHRIPDAGYRRPIRTQNSELRTENRQPTMQATAPLPPRGTRRRRRRAPVNHPVPRRPHRSRERVYRPAPQQDPP